MTRADVLDLAGKTTIEEMAALISSLDLFITNDTGPMHVAAALGIPVVAIFGATTPALGFAPYTEKSRVVEPPNRLECRPCSPHGPKACPKEHFRCMNEITPESVIEAAKSLLIRC
jgi:heptosyltransferase-2